MACSFWRWGPDGSVPTFIARVNVRNARPKSPVVAAVALEGIGATAAQQPVEAATALDVIAAGVAAQRVVARAAEDTVVAAPTADHVSAGERVDAIGLIGAGKLVRAGRAANRRERHEILLERRNAELILEPRCGVGHCCYLLPTATASVMIVLPGVPIIIVF